MQPTSQPDPKDGPPQEALDLGWKEFERITYSPLPKSQGGYTPSQGAFEFAFKTAWAAALRASGAGTRQEEPDLETMWDELYQRLRELRIREIAESRPNE